MNRTEHHTTVSELGFTVNPADLAIVNAYTGVWTVTGAPQKPDNYWVITTDGTGHAVTGQGSPQQILDRGRANGWDCAYAAPYGRHVEGTDDGVALHDWIREGRKAARHSKS